MQLIKSTLYKNTLFYIFLHFIQQHYYVKRKLYSTLIQRKKNIIFTKALKYHLKITNCGSNIVTPQKYMFHNELII